MASSSSSIYLRNLSPKLRPALDLLRSAVAALPNSSDTVERVLDVGCGNGAMTKYLCDAFPNATIHGIDLSAAMVESARQGMSSIPGLRHRRVSFENDTIENFIKHDPTDPGNVPGKFDVIYANSSLQWLPGLKRAEILKALVASRLQPKGGVLAVQMPDTAQQASHLLMETAALRAGLIDQMYAVVAQQRVVHDTSAYHRLLTPVCRDVDIWTTTYVHQLQHHGSAKQAWHPVLEHTRYKTTGLLPYMRAVGGEDTDDGKRFLTEYNRLLNEAYPVVNAGNSSYKSGARLTLFPFKRFFLVCQS